VGPAPPAWFVRVWFVAGLITFALCFWAAVDIASADPVPYEPPKDKIEQPVLDPEPRECPAEPDPLNTPEEEYSEEVQELRQLRILNARTCRAIADRQDVISERAWWLVVEAAEGRAQRVLTNERLTQLLDGQCEEPCPVVITGNPGGEVDAIETVSAIDATGEALKSALYVVAGLLAGMILALMLWQTWRRAA
jgi:hypothetical protein